MKLLLTLAAAVLCSGCAPTFGQAWRDSPFLGMSLEDLRAVNRALCEQSVSEWQEVVDITADAGMRRIAETELGYERERCQAYLTGEQP